MATENSNGNNPLLRLLRPSVVVLCGPSACGKSTFAKKHFRPTQIISSDWARALISDDERDQRFNSQAFALVHFLVEQRLSVNRLCVVDSTALTAPARKSLLDLAKKCQVPTTLILFDVPLQTCVERDEKRERSVGRTIVERQYLAFEQARETIRVEGFGQVVELHEANMEKVQIEILFRPVQRAARVEPAPPRRSDRWAPPLGQRSNGPQNGQSIATASVSSPSAASAGPTSTAPAPPVFAPPAPGPERAPASTPQPSVGSLQRAVSKGH